METRKYILVLLGLLIGAAGLQSCDKNFAEINTNPNSSKDAFPYQFLGSALVTSMSTNMNRNRTYTNELMQVTVSLGEGDGKVFRYDIRPSVSTALWDGLYVQLNNFREMYLKASDPVTANTSYQGISLVCQAWLYSILTDTYGDIPYSQALLGRDSSIFEPKFDAQKEVYMGLFDKLDSANALLQKNVAIEGTQDPLFAGNVSRWRKFGNSLYLRLLLRISGKSEMHDQVVAKIKEMLETNASNYPIMASNEESAILRWTGTAPFTSPYITVRTQDFHATAICSFFIDNLVAWNDPRIDIPTYGAGGVNRWGIATSGGQFIGVPSGYSQGVDYERLSYFYSSDQVSGGGVSLQTEPMTGMIMNYAEVQFIKAEAALKGWISGSVKDFYESGVQNSITLWVPSWDASVEDYLNAADQPWNEEETLDQKMEKIHLQKYYALFLCDLQQWFEYRRTGHPILPKGQGLKNNGVMPARMVYPVYLQSSNPTSYKNAVAVQGPDLISTQMWWQQAD